MKQNKQNLHYAGDICNQEFLLLGSTGAYSDYVDKQCVIQFNQKNQMLEMYNINSDKKRCYRVQENSAIYCLLKSENPEYFL